MTETTTSSTSLDRIVAYTHALKTFIARCEVKVSVGEESGLDRIRMARLALSETEWGWITSGAITEETTK